MSTSRAALTACWSISLGEISRAIWPPRFFSSSAIAIPGKRCPPVPPHAMATKGILVSGSFMWGGRKRIIACFLNGRFAIIFRTFFAHGRMAGDAEQQANTGQHGQEVRPAIADERQRQALIRQSAGNNADVDGGLQGN